MKVSLKIKEDIEIKTLHVSAEVRYWEDATVNGIVDSEGTLIPFRNGDNWEPIILIDYGKIIDWPEGMVAQIHYKVCDAGEYTVKDYEGKEVFKTDGYVPDILSAAENGYGDYIILQVEPDGRIDNCRNHTTSESLTSSFFPLIHHAFVSAQLSW